MPQTPKADKDLLDRIAAMGTAKHQLDANVIKDVVHDVLNSLEGDITKQDAMVFTKLQGLADYMNKAREELKGIGQNVKPDEIMTATDELEAVVAMTEDAANSILDAAEQIENVANQLDATNADALRVATTKIYEASNFQDVTGQRIRKVVRILQHLEEGINSIITTFGFDESQSNGRVISADDPASLLNGPQLPDDAANQDAIDALFDSIDEDPKA